MAYNKAKEEYRWKQWKSEEEKILREQGVDEETIQKLREYDWNDFNAERRFREHQTSLLDCMELLLEEKETKESQPESVEACWIPKNIQRRTIKTAPPSAKISIQPEQKLRVASSNA